MRLAASILPILVTLIACKATTTPMEVEDILSVCHTSTSDEGCENLNGKVVTVRGFLDNSGYYDNPVLTSGASVIENYDREKLENIYAIEFLISDVTRQDYTPYLKQRVIVTGKIFTDCVPKAIKMKKFNEEQHKKSKDGSDDIIITRRMLTGECHYVTNPNMVDVEITVVK